MAKLNQVIAIEKGVKARVFGFLSSTYKAFQKPALFNGLSRQYQKKDEDGEDYPPEHVRVQMNADALIAEIGEQMTELFDITAQKDWANCEAKADVVVDGQVLIEGAPATYLLFLEKQLNDLKDELNKIPELDAAHDWMLDAATNIYKSAATLTSKTKKVPKVIVKYEATEHHPAQTEIVHVDEVVGTWQTTQHSGALPEPRKRTLQKRLQTLIKAVKFAREAANEASAPKKDVGAAVFAYLFASS
ncbi:MAG: hypothetical protein KC933_38635 [Myxococcales bacterium]|nr:hypothetical protein [Myxococcales bacterium]MCB9647330.1 hypothetical protein [Deltaproteobacteria bacterium]